MGHQLRFGCMQQVCRDSLEPDAVEGYGYGNQGACGEKKVPLQQPSKVLEHCVASTTSGQGAVLDAGNRPVRITVRVSDGWDAAEPSGMEWNINLNVKADHH